MRIVLSLTSVGLLTVLAGFSSNEVGPVAVSLRIIDDATGRERVLDIYRDAIRAWRTMRADQLRP